MDHEQWLKLHDEWLEHHNRAIAEHDREIAESRRQFEREMAESRRQHDKDMLAIRQMLRHAVQLAVREARAERRKRQELDDKITQLAAAQLITEEKFKRLIERDERRYGGNGNPQP